jgi:hypothetical protein
MRRMATIAAGLTMLTISGIAQADNVMKVCGAKYQAAKTAKTLPAGQTWNQFLAQCRGTVSAATPAGAAPVAAGAPAAAKAVAQKSAAAPSAAMAAMHDRQRKCGQMWSADKAAGKIPTGQTWPKYWSACNTKLKG